MELVSNISFLIFIISVLLAIAITLLYCEIDMMFSFKNRFQHSGKFYFPSKHDLVPSPWKEILALCYWIGTISFLFFSIT